MTGHTQSFENGRWVQAVPLPYIFFGHVVCGECREKFFGRRANTMPRYNTHWRQEHGR